MGGAVLRPSWCERFWALLGSGGCRLCAQLAEASGPSTHVEAYRPDYPYSLVSRELRGIIRGLLAKAAGSLELFFDHCLFTMLQELDKTPGEGDREGEPAPSWGPVSFFLASEVAGLFPVEKHANADTLGKGGGS